MNELKKRYELKHEKIVWAKLCNEFVFVVIDESKYSFADILKSLNFTTKSSLDILEGLLLKRSPEKIIKCLMKKHKTSYKKTEANYLTLLRQLKKLKLITNLSYENLFKKYIST
ncbi:MAG: hypothetical protein ABIE81_04885 [Candidatus Omnitrophota bacterium]